MFPVFSTNSVGELADFLHQQRGRKVFSELVVGNFLGADVRLIKDDEFSDRFFLRIAADGNLLDFQVESFMADDFEQALGEAALTFL